jgi:hypothetical protein
MITLLYLSGCANTDAATPVQQLVPMSPEPKSARPLACQCSPNFDELGCDSGDIDNDCVCNHEDNCRMGPNCDRANADGDAFGDVCDELPNTPNPEDALADIDARLDALEAALLMGDG